MVSVYTREVAAPLARTLWSLHWANWVEEEGGRFPAGSELTELAPETPVEYLHTAFYALGYLEAVNNKNIVQMLMDATKADGYGRDEMGCIKDDYLEDFGHTLALEMSGTGVCWTDDHKDFDLICPAILEHDCIWSALMDLPEFPEEYKPKEQPTP